MNEIAHPWGEDRIALEQAAIITSWDDNAQAKRLTEFPNEAWQRQGHRIIVEAIRGFLTHNEQVNPIRIHAWIKANAPEADYDFQQCFIISSEDFLRYSGLHNQAIADLREAYEWQLGYQLIRELGTGIKKGRFVDWYQRLQQATRALAPDTEDNAIRKLSDITRERLEEHRSGEIDKQRIPTGIPWLDAKLGGLFPDRLYVLCGGPGCGKTTILQEIVKNTARAGYEAHIFQGDMPAEEMGERNAISDVGKRIEEFADADYELALSLLDRVDGITVDDRSLETEAWEARAASIKARRPALAIMATDFAGQVESGGWSAADKGERIAKSARRIAKDNRTCHLLLQQPTQEYEAAQWPRKQFVRGGKFFEMLAHVMIWIHYPHNFNPTMPEDYVQLHFLKNRGGALGIVPIKWDKARYSMAPWPGNKILNPEPGIYCDPFDDMDPRPAFEELDMEDVPL